MTEQIHLFKDTVVRQDGEFAIVECTRIFGTGWNVYRRDSAGGSTYTKINERGSFFASLEAAEKWLVGFKSGH